MLSKAAGVLSRLSSATTSGNEDVIASKIVQSSMSGDASKVHAPPELPSHSIGASSSSATHESMMRAAEASIRSASWTDAAAHSQEAEHKLDLRASGTSEADAGPESDKTAAEAALAAVRFARCVALLRAGRGAAALDAARQLHTCLSTAGKKSGDGSGRPEVLAPVLLEASAWLSQGRPADAAAVLALAAWRANALPSGGKRGSGVTSEGESKAEAASGGTAADSGTSDDTYAPHCKAPLLAALGRALLELGDRVSAAPGDAYRLLSGAVEGSRARRAAGSGISSSSGVEGSSGGVEGSGSPPAALVARLATDPHGSAMQCMVSAAEELDGDRNASSSVHRIAVPCGSAFAWSQAGRCALQANRVSAAERCMGRARELAVEFGSAGPGSKKATGGLEGAEGAALGRVIESLPALSGGASHGGASEVRGKDVSALGRDAASVACCLWQDAGLWMVRRGFDSEAAECFDVAAALAARAMGAGEGEDEGEDGGASQDSAAIAAARAGLPPWVGAGLGHGAIKIKAEGGSDNDTGLCSSARGLLAAAADAHACCGTVGVTSVLDLQEQLSTSMGNSALAHVRRGALLEGVARLEAALCMHPPVGCTPTRATNLRTLYDLTRTPRSAAAQKAAVAALARRYRITAPAAPPKEQGAGGAGGAAARGGAATAAGRR